MMSRTISNGESPHSSAPALEKIGLIRVQTNSLPLLWTLYKHNTKHGKINNRRYPALDLVLGGPGTGKSRMLDEMKSILSKSAQASGDKELITRMNNAFEFRISLDSDTTRFSGLLDNMFPELDISCRFLYQMRDDVNESWDAFARRWNHLSGWLTIDEVIGILAHAENIDKVEDMTVILSVDGA
ncbi:hypothetical protein AeRB84_002123 [Aphanomyces euteiches]|nr:hypothetical protein AeRB84_002123 [Aphanomyces euteiches]